MSKHITYRYDLGPDETRGGWGAAILTSDGLFAAATDYGNYCRFWHHYRPRAEGDEFRRMFCEFGREYLLSKLCKTEYDAEATVVELRKDVLELRRHKRITKQQARNAWYEIDEIESSGHEGEFVNFVQETDLPDAFEYCPVYGYPAEAVAFVDRFLARLKELIRADIEANPYVPQEAHEPRS